MRLLFVFALENKLIGHGVQFNLDAFNKLVSIRPFDLLTREKTLNDHPVQNAFPPLHPLKVRYKVKDFLVSNGFELTKVVVH